MSDTVTLTVTKPVLEMIAHLKTRPVPAYQEKSEGLVCEAFRLLLEGNCVSHTSSSMIVLGKQVREVWKIPRIPPRASPSEEYSEFPDFSSLFTQDYYKLILLCCIARPYCCCAVAGRTEKV